MQYRIIFLMFVGEKPSSYSEQFDCIYITSFAEMNEMTKLDVSNVLEEELSKYVRKWVHIRWSQTSKIYDYALHIIAILFTKGWHKNGCK